MQGERLRQAHLVRNALRDGLRAMPRRKEPATRRRRSSHWNHRARTSRISPSPRWTRLVAMTDLAFQTIESSHNRICKRGSV